MQKIREYPVRHEACMLNLNLNAYKDASSIQPNLPFRLKQRRGAGRKQTVLSSAPALLRAATVKPRYATGIGQALGFDEACHVMGSNGEMHHSRYPG